MPPPASPPCCSELERRGLEASYVEEEVEAASVGKGSVAVGEVADNIAADLVVLSTAGVWKGPGGWLVAPGACSRELLCCVVGDQERGRGAEHVSIACSARCC